ncbi:unnamed protein product [Ectocarpus sp. CCAP 1310/34]|nr:unnamed protein product [Ectocarpus sp. CCAP 1310/34]
MPTKALFEEAIKPVKNDFPANYNLLMKNDLEKWTHTPCHPQQPGQPEDVHLKLCGVQHFRGRPPETGNGPLSFPHRDCGENCGATRNECRTAEGLPCHPRSIRGQVHGGREVAQVSTGATTPGAFLVLSSVDSTAAWSVGCSTTPSVG